MKKAIAILGMTIFTVSASALELTKSCETEVLREVKTRSLLMSQEVFRATGGNLAPFLGVACKNAPITVENIDSESLKVKMTVNPWFGPTKNLKVKCDESELDKLPQVEVTVTKNEFESCEIRLTKIKAGFDLTD